MKMKPFLKRFLWGFCLTLVPLALYASPLNNLPPELRNVPLTPEQRILVQKYKGDLEKFGFDESMLNASGESEPEATTPKKSKTPEAEPQGAGDEQEIMEEVSQERETAPSVSLASSKIEAMFQQYAKTPLFEGKIATGGISDEDTLDYREIYQSNADTTPRTALDQFGYNVFKDNSDTIFDSSAVAVEASYRLGPGDRLNITVWGKIEQLLDVTLDADGKIFLVGVGHVSLLGVEFGAASQVIETALRTKYVNFEVSVSLAELRKIRVFVLGEVGAPGAYQVSSVATLMHALYASGGPSKLGTLRNIKLVRKGAKTKSVDLYDYLIFGNQKQDYVLRDSDTIFIPPIGDVVAIRGEVKRPGIYEIKASDTLQTVLRYSGGALPNAPSQRVQIERIGKIGQTKILDVLTQSSDGDRRIKTTKMKSGDFVTVIPYLTKLDHYVTVRGYVEQPGRYEFKKGMTLSDLIAQAQGLKEKPYLSHVEILRFVSETDRRVERVDITETRGRGVLLEDKDLVSFFSEREIRGGEYVIVEGAVQASGTYKLIENMRVSDLLFSAKLDPFANRDIVELFRREPGKMPEIITLNLDAILNKSTPEQDLLLKDRDRVFVRMQSQSLQKRIVTIKGEVLYPGTYVAREGEPLSSVIARAGGFTNRAFLKGAILTRESNKSARAMGQQRLIEDEQKKTAYDKRHLASISQDPVALNNAIQSSREYVVSDLNEKLKEFDGRLLIRLEPYATFPGSISDVSVEGGDVLTIPEKPVSVHLVGGVKNPSSIIYRGNKNAQFYIDKVGGYSQFADRGAMYIFRPDGTISTNLKTVGEGDIIYVPEKVIIPFNFMVFLTNITSILANAATAVATVQILSGN